MAWNFPLVTRFRIGARLGLLVAALVNYCYSATYTWDGGGGDGNWLTAGNWSPDGAPARTAGHDLAFAGTLNTTTNANNGGWSVNSLTFSNTACAFTSGGGTLTIGAGGITNNSTATQTVNNQVSLGANQTWNAANGAIVTGTSQVGAGGRNLTLTGNGAISIGGQVGNVGVLTLSGAGNRTFSNTNTFSATTINASSTGTNTFAAQVNATTINLTSGNHLFTRTTTSAQAGNGGLNISGNASATFSGNVAGGNGGINISSSGDIVFAASITGGSLTLNGTGTTTLAANGSNNISNTIVNSGTLIMDQSGSGHSINGPLTVNNGGTVIFAGDGQVPHWQTVTLNEGSSLFLGDTAQTIQNLIINGDSVIDFGSGGSQFNVSGSITIADNITLTIVNWNEGDVFAGNNPGAPVVNVQYADNDGTIYASGTWGGGTISPGAPIPEPAAAGFLLLGGSLALVLLRRRPRR